MRVIKIVIKIFFRLILSILLTTCTHAAGPCDNFSKNERCANPTEKMHCSEQKDDTGRVVAARQCFIAFIIEPGFTIHINVEEGKLTTVPCPRGTYNNLRSYSNEITKCYPHLPCDRLADNMVPLEPARPDRPLKCVCDKGYTLRGSRPYCDEIDPDFNACHCIRQTQTSDPTFCSNGTGIQGNSKVCEECPQGTFNNGQYKICQTLTVCGKGETVLFTGSKKRDRECGYSSLQQTTHSSTGSSMATVTTRTSPRDIAATNTAVIVGASVGTIVVCVIIIGGIICRRRMKKLKKKAVGQAIIELGIKERPEQKPLVKRPIKVTDTNAQCKDAANPDAFHDDTEDNINNDI